VNNWEKSLRVFTDTAEILVPAEPQRARLEQILSKVRRITRQDSHTSGSRHEHIDLLKEGGEQARVCAEWSRTSLAPRPRPCAVQRRTHPLACPQDGPEAPEPTLTPQDSERRGIIMANTAILGPRLARSKDAMPILA
jgi:hypothetical protein